MQSELRPVLARLKFGSGFGASLFREPVSGQVQIVAALGKNVEEFGEIFGK